jgi:hypothetical protein
LHLGLPFRHDSHAIPPFFPNWHASCKAVRIGGSPAGQIRGNKHMTAFSTYSQRLVAGFAAIAISGLLFVNTLATKAAEVNSVAGILV